MTDTLGDLKTAIQRELFNRTDLTDEIAAAINSAIYHYQKKKFWFTEEQETASTVQNQPSIAWPSDFGWVDGLTILYASGTLPIRMTRIDWKTMLEYGVNSTVSPGLPLEYAIYADQLWFWPTPNGAYTLTLYENFLNAPPTADTDTSDWTTGGKAEELIRSRAVGDILCHILRRPDSLTELAALGQEPFFTKREMVAYRNLLGFSNQRLSSGRIKPIQF